MAAAAQGTVACALRAAQVPPAVARGYEDATGIVRLRAWQRDVLEGPDGVAAGASAVVTVDTAGGKSCIAEVALLRGAFWGKGGVALYVLPYLALVAEKARTLRRALRDHDGRCARKDRCAVVDCGEGPDAPRASLAMARAIVCCTPEAALGLLDRQALAAADARARRRRGGAADDAGGSMGRLRAVAVDELHMVGDAGRGAAYEKLLTRLRLRGGATQLIGLSATLSNVEAVAAWLGCRATVARCRPVALRPRFVTEATAADAARRVVAEARAAHESCLLFCWRREDTARLAERICGEPQRKSEQDRAARRAALRALPRRGDARLRRLLEREDGDALFHSAALTPEERTAVEAAATGSAARVVCCTETLAAGVNLPAAKVVVLCGVDKFPNNAVQLAQMLGRAGRGGATGARRGEAVVVAPRRHAARARGMLEQATARSTLPPVRSGLARAADAPEALARLLLEAVCATEAEGVAFDAVEGPRAVARATLFRKLADDPRAVDAACGDALASLEAARCVDVDAAGAARTTALGRAVLAAGDVKPLEAVLLEEALTRARCAPASSAAAALARAAVCAPLPGLDYHLDRELFDTKVFWDFLVALVENGGRDAETAAAHLGLDVARLERDAHATARTDPLPTAVEILRDVRRGRWGPARRATRLFVARRLWLGVLVDALLSPAAPGAVATPAPASLEELSRLTKIPEPSLEKLARRAPVFAGAVARFCRRLNWTCVADGLDERAGALRRALRAFDKRPGSWRRELRGLRKACGGDVQLARALRDANYRAATDITDAGVDAVERALADAAPWRLAGVDVVVSGSARRRHDASWSETPFLVSLLSATRTTGAEAAAAAAARRAAVAAGVVAAAAAARTGPARAAARRRTEATESEDSDCSAAPSFFDASSSDSDDDNDAAADSNGTEDDAADGHARKRRRGSGHTVGLETYASSRDGSPRSRSEESSDVQVRDVSPRVLASDARRRTRALDARESAALASTDAPFVGVSLDTAAPPPPASGARRRAWAKFLDPRTSRVLVGCGLARGPGEATYYYSPPVPPPWPFERELRHRNDGIALGWARLPEAAVCRVVGWLGFRQYAAHLGAPRDGRAAGGAARLACRAWHARGRRALRACERLAGGRVALAATVAAPNRGDAYALACGDAVAVATALRSNGTPAGRPLFDVPAAKVVAARAAGGAADGAANGPANGPADASDDDGDREAARQRRDRVVARAVALARDARTCRDALAAPACGRALAALLATDVACVPAIAEMNHSGVDVDAPRLRAWVDDLRQFVDDCRRVASEAHGIENLEAHGKVNALCDVLAKKASTSAARGLAAQVQRGGRAGERAAVVLAHRRARALLTRLLGLQRALAPHPTLESSTTCARACFSLSCKTKRGLEPTATGRLVCSAPNFQNFDAAGVTMTRFARPSLHEDPEDALPGIQVLCVDATVPPGEPPRLRRGALVELSGATIDAHRLADGASIADYWRDEARRGATWAYSARRAATVRAAVVRIRRHELTYPADFVYRLDRGPLFSPPGFAWPEDGSVRETERAARYSPFDHAICVEPRRLIIARRGAVFLSADLKQCELRVAAHLSGDARLRRCFEERGNDPFVELMERCAAVKDRAAAKQLVYAVLFGQSTRKAAHALNVDARAAVDAVQQVRALFPALDAYRATVTAACREHGFVETVLGRRRRLPDIHSADPKRRRKAERQALNAIVQGSAADLVKRAMASMVASFGARYDARRRPRLVLQLHDELVFEVPTHQLATCALDVSSALEAATALEGVPAEVRLRAGPSWAALEPYDPYSAVPPPGVG